MPLSEAMQPLAEEGAVQALPSEQGQRSRRAHGPLPHEYADGQKEVRHHVKEEEQEFFPQVREIVIIHVEATFDGPI